MEDAYKILSENPSLMKNADQWIEDGYVFCRGLVYTYEIDRKEQTQKVFGSFTVDEFLERPDITEEERQWILGLLP